MSLNLAVLLTATTKRYPAETAIIFEGLHLSYAQLNAASNQFANALQEAGIKRGDKVSLMLPNIPQFPIAYYGILKVGAVAVPMNVLLKSDEIEYLLSNSDATALITFEGFMGEAVKAVERVKSCKTLVVAQSPGSQIPLPSGDNVYSFSAFHAAKSPNFDLVPTMPDETAVILYTSGTTGKPKGAELTHFNLFYNAQFGGDKLVQTNPGDVALGILPLFHVFGQTNVMNSFISRGASITLIPRFDPVKALQVIERDKVTHIAAVPTMYFALLHCPERTKYDTSSLRLGLSGGSAMPVEVLHEFEKVYGFPILEGYGLSETSPTASFNMMDRPRKVGSIGLAIWGVEMKIFNDQDQEVAQGELGEIVVRGHNVMKCYYKNPTATAEAMRNDWFHTGDVAYVDEEGYFFIVDRIKDMIIRGGLNVYPREIEEVLYQHSAISEAAVIGVADQKFGEEVGAYVTFKPGCSATPEEIIEFAKSKLAGYKYPRTIIILDTLPKGPTGKILKRELKLMLPTLA